uniref:Uncharacterized protein n=1 Tax=Kwoniella bestiolae CBS 10118 TaxID=1296100 RepID=A0A1B9G2P8_9TREE|nr:hypothetical protein I302_05113 [Kwoniella bestiolae CBS 10118]OCF25299.1 hypothetical protein I302_05113 [Kwoniella bestiolae CBS 10118]
MIEVGTQNLNARSLTPTYEVTPGEGVGIFQLGDNLWHALELIRTHKTEYPKVEVSWDVDSPHKSATTIHLPHLTLYFPPSPIYQLLSLITITLPSPSSNSSSSISPANQLELSYETEILSSAHMPLTRARVGRLMGPTFLDKAGDKLDFPGITFILHSDNLGDAGFGPREDVVHRIMVKPGEDEELQARLISCVIQPNKGITLALDEDHILPITIGETTSQDLLLDLGAPLRKFWKEDDRLEKMWGGDPHKENGKGFWNYFQYGLDFLVSKDGIVIKILCHSNIPGTPLFQRYARCPWILPISSGNLDMTSPLRSFRSNLSKSEKSQEYVVEKKKRGGSPNTNNSSENESNSATKGRDDRKEEDEQGDAMILDRLVEGGLEGVSNLGPSKLVGFDGLIIEQDEKSGGICSVLVYRDDTKTQNL